MGQNDNKVNEIYGKNMGEQICKIPIIANGPNNQRVWFHNPHRFYTSKVAHDILPTYEKISTIRQEFKSDFPRCGACNETLIHALKDCPTTREFLVLGGLNNNLQLVIIHSILTRLKT
ncbi:hypothetical protein Gorai_021825 [Gossypium raimondii]|uniref:Reverse transcriptase zinc-binding domain-containing protein n=1 Tax=Gossypium raimondii TaxID=29730 RepID=A0A7J8NS40_GOSRA|nr:hypothetical protein [Gossypium raimondii]